MGQASDRGLDAEEDPLVELARIVSEDGGFGPPKTEKPKVNRHEPVERNAFSDGLEAELLQELESSFAAREIPVPVSPRTSAQRDVAAQSNPRAATPVPPPPVEDKRDPDDLLRSIEEQLGQFERRQAERFATTSTDFASESFGSDPPAESGWTDPAPEPAPPVFGAPDYTAAPRDAPREEWQSRRAPRIRPILDDDTESDAAPEPRWQEPPARPAPPPPEYRFRGQANADWDRAARDDEAAPAANRDEFRRAEEPARFVVEEPPEVDPFARTDVAPAKTGGLRDIYGNDDAIRRARDEHLDAAPAEEFRREQRPTTFPEFDEPPLREQRLEADLASVEAGLSRALEPDYDDQSRVDQWQGAGAVAADDEPRVAAAIAPGPSRRAAAARNAAARRGRSRVGLLTAAGVILVVLIGGAGALYLRSTEGASSALPPVIAADDAAVKIAASPEQAAAEGETVGEAVYNRVAGGASETEEQVVDSAEEPREIARIVLPPSQTDTDAALVRPVGEGEGATASATETVEDEIGPRRVPTFVVRPDGTIVATSEAPESSGATEEEPQAAAVEPQPVEPIPVPTVAVGEAEAAASAAAPAAPAPTATETLAPAATEEMTPRPAIEEPADLAAVAPPEAAPAPAPVDLLTSAEAQALPAPTASDGFLVQVSSQRSLDQAQASFADMRQRYASVLGSLDPTIQEANLGEKGIYYRVRVGPWASREEAIAVCESLKSVGGTCFVTR